MSFEETIQAFTPGDYVELYQLDTSLYSGPTYFFTSNIYSDASSLFFDGQEYQPIPIEATGFEWSGEGALPRPTLKVANIDGLIGSLASTYSDLLGATFRRIRTFKQFLDDGATPDPTSMYPMDIYRVERKVNQNKIFIEWELSTAMDQQGVMLPKRQALKDACTHTYRIYDADLTDLFDYTKATCPYAEASYFTVNGVVTTDPSADSCGRRLSDCRKRFGTTAELPFRGFPGMRVVR